MEWQICTNWKKIFYKIEQIAKINKLSKNKYNIIIPISYPSSSHRAHH
jgi:hypothetical protein